MSDATFLLYVEECLLFLWVWRRVWAVTHILCVLLVWSVAHCEQKEERNSSCSALLMASRTVTSSTVWKHTHEVRGALPQVVAADWGIRGSTMMSLTYATQNACSNAQKYPRPYPPLTYGTDPRKSRSCLTNGKTLPTGSITRCLELHHVHRDNVSQRRNGFRLMLTDTHIHRYRAERERESRA